MPKKRPKVYTGKRGGKYVLDRIGRGKNKGKVRRKYV